MLSHRLRAQTDVVRLIGYLIIIINKMELEMDMESRSNSNADFEVREPNRSNSITSETSYKYLASENSNVKSQELKKKKES